MTRRGRTLREIWEKDGVIVLGSPDVKCPHCGAPPVVREGVTPLKGQPLRIYMPDFDCCPARRSQR
jgi:hypothetical protein